MRCYLVLAVLLISMAPGLAAQSTSDTESGANFDVVLIGDRMMDSVREGIGKALMDSTPNHTLRNITGENLGLDGHLEFYSDGLLPWSTTLSEQSDFLILQPKSTRMATIVDSSDYDTIAQSFEEFASISNQMPAEHVIFVPWAHKNGDQSRPITVGDFPTMESMIRNTTTSLVENESSGLRFVIPVGMAFNTVYLDDLASGVNPLDPTSNFSSLYSDDVASSEVGSYLVACTVIKSLFNDDCDPSNRPDLIDLSTANYLIGVAERTLDSLPNGLAVPYEDNRAKVRFRNFEGGTYSIQPGSSIGVSLFVRNFAETDVVAVVNLTGPSYWSWSWEDEPAALGSRVVNLGSDEEVTLTFLIHAPASSDGGPIAGSIHEFEATIIDQFGARDNWAFRLDLGRERSIEISSGGGSISLPPDSTTLVEFEIRNTGNSADDIQAELFAFVDGVEKAGSLLSVDGWGVLLLDEARATNVGPWETGLIRMQISSPSDSTGTLDIGLRAGPTGMAFQDDAFTSLIISTRISGMLSINDGDCQEVEPGQDCTVELTVTNNGIGTTTYGITHHGKPDWAEIDSIEDVVIEGNEDASLELVIGVGEDAMIGRTEEIEFRLMIDNLIIDVKPINLGVYSEAVLELNEDALCLETQDGIFRMSIIVTNSGREADSIEAVVDVSQAIRHGFIVDERYTQDRSMRYDPIGHQEIQEIQVWSDSSQGVTRLSVSLAPVGNPGNSIEGICTFSIGEGPSDNEATAEFTEVLQVLMLLAIAMVCTTFLLMVRRSIKTRKDHDSISNEPATMPADQFAEGFKRSSVRYASHDSVEIARSNRALDVGTLDSVIRDIDNLPSPNDQVGAKKSSRSEDDIDEIMRDLID